MTKKSAIFKHPFAVSNCSYFIALVSLAGSLLLCYYYFVRTTSGRAVDQLAFHQASIVGQNLVAGAAQWLDRLPEISVFITALVIVVLLFRQNSRQLWYRLVVVVIFMAAALLNTRLLKHYVFDRPDIGLDDWYTNSLPSGHVTLATAAFSTIFLMVPTRWRPFAGFIGAVFVIITGISTVLSQWHRPSDVVAAFLVVAFWALACSWILLSFPTYFTPQSKKSSRYTLLHNSILFRALTSHSWGQWAAWPILTVFGSFLGFLLTFFEIQQAPPENSVADMTSTAPDNTHYFWAGVWFIVCVGFFLASCAIIWFRIFDPIPIPLQQSSVTYEVSPLIYFPRNKSPLPRKIHTQSVPAPILNTHIYDRGLEPLFRISGQGPANIPIPHQDLSHRYETMASYEHPYLSVDDLYWKNQRQPQYFLNERTLAQEIPQEINHSPQVSKISQIVIGD